jgi:hypothetical protein
MSVAVAAGRVSRTVPPQSLSLEATLKRLLSIDPEGHGHIKALAELALRRALARLPERRKLPRPRLTE